MNSWQQLITLTLTPTVVILVVGFLIRKFIEQTFKRDLEKFKIELERKTFKQYEKFSWINQKRSEVITGLYRKLVEAKDQTGALVHIIQIGGQNLPEKQKHVIKSYNDLNKYFHKNRLFLTNNVVCKTQELVEILGDIISKFEQSQLGNKEYKPDKTGLWHEASKDIRNKVPPLLQALEKKFKEIIGMNEDES
ncbi:MAG: hypothetical protein K9M80_02135 [Candidatus Marinimicrobia bacterium]|nr:hypothetical protein [Candidatus Neomarinimicrobiota bacterium]